MLKKIYFTLLLAITFALPAAFAQPFDPCDPEMVTSLQEFLQGEGATCLEGAGPFTCVEDVIDYMNANCPIQFDTTNVDTIDLTCDPIAVADLQNQMIEDGYDCLIGAGPFACMSDVFAYVDANCFSGNSSDCDPATVATYQANMIADGYDCLVGAGPFACINDVVLYALDNCPWGPDTTTVELPPCLTGIPQSLTMQQIIHYIAENCDSVMVPACYLTAPTFNTDEEYLEWLSENCPDDFDGMMTGEQDGLLAAFSATANSVLSAGQAQQQLAQISVSPNPSTTVFDVRATGAELISRVQMIDFSGRVVYEKSNAAAHRVMIPSHSFAAGIYFIKVQDEKGQTAVVKAVKQ